LNPPSSLGLRRLRLCDLEAVLAIERLAFPTPTKSNVYRYELTENRLAHYQAMTLREDGGTEKVIGYAGYWLLADEAHISTIAVHPACRGRGYGELLLLNILFLAYEQEAGLVTLEVRRHNQVAQTLYRKYQFEVVGERRRYYRDTGEDALIMSVSRLDEGYFAFLEKERAQLFARLMSEA
jgi:ribosomal-protein-alanine N-acetyltransferase